MSATVLAEPLLVIDRLHAGYRDIPIVHGVSAQVNAGEIVCVIGPNGAGKSTLIKATMGLLKVFEGQIRFGGEDITRARPESMVARGLGYVPQVSNVFGSLSVRENLALAVKSRRETADAMASVLTIFPELEPKLPVSAGTLSGGERQMLAFARCLITKPRLLLLDEPTAALSPLMVGMIFRKIKEIAATGTAIFLIEQNAIKALAIADRAYVLSSGTNAAEGTGAELLANPAIKEMYLGGHGAAPARGTGQTKEAS